jgi:hypothetical protein
VDGEGIEELVGHDEGSFIEFWCSLGSDQYVFAGGIYLRVRNGYSLSILHSIERSPWTWSKTKHWKFGPTLALLALAMIGINGQVDTNNLSPQYWPQQYK